MVRMDQGLCENGPGAAPSQAEPVSADFKTDPWLHRTGGTSVETF